MVVAWHDAAFTLPSAILSKDVMLNVLHKFHLQHKLKVNWSKEEARLFEKLLSMEELATSTKDSENSADSKKKTQNEIMQEIENDRIRLRSMREK